MRFFADFHIHSRFCRGVHPDMEIPTLVKWAKIKGLALLGTGDFTHPQWRVELKKFLKPSGGRGIYEYKDVRFLLTGEVSCVYTRSGKSYKIHHLIFVPNFSTADRLIAALGRHGDLDADGRPSLGLTARDLVKAVREVSPECLVAPAHVWDAQHSLFSAQSGYESWREAYGDQADFVRVVETGLRADPSHARRCGALDGKTLISNSDAHHPSHLGREANLLDCPMDYKDITAALLKNDRTRFLSTLEAYAEEDRHYETGHRACGPAGGDNGPRALCPGCGKPRVPGLADRLEALAGRSLEEAGPRAEPHQKIIPLVAVLAEALGFQPEAESVQRQYFQITSQLGSELDILLHWPPERLRKELPFRVAEGVLAARRGEVSVETGHDGVPGRVRIRFPAELSHDPGQLKLF